MCNPATCPKLYQLDREVRNLANTIGHVRNECAEEYERLSKEVSNLLFVVTSLRKEVYRGK